ncbi:MAG: nucleotidyltransferase domain-containing protein [Lachnospiraceae bacterium]|nr:nucleotidyltransferase domain-containing protein [Lachnospiraceae bacterium]
MSELKEKRIQSKLTQKEAAEKIGVSLRSYITYENDEEKMNTPKYRFFLEEIGRMNMLDEEHGVLSIEDIRDICKNVFDLYEVDYCYLFGSYAKGKAVETSDVDLLIATETTGLRFFELTERLRQQLRKKVDLLDYKQLINNEALLNEVLKDGVKIYG